MSLTFSLITCVLISTASLSSWAQEPAEIFAKRASRGNKFNPEISANLLGLFQRGSALSDDRADVPHNGFSLQEAEFQFAADVDPYLRAYAVLAVVQEDGSAEYIAEPEEIYLETIALKAFTVKVGKFKLALGKHNQLHTHAMPFIDEPLIHQQLLGGEGLNESGVSVSYLIPVNWYSEVQAQAFSLSNEELFDSTKSGDMGGLVHLKNLWDLSDALTMEWGLSGVTGQNQFERNSSVLGVDLTFKWRPTVGGKYRSLVWSTEYLNANRKGFVNPVTDESLEKLGGLATWLQYQFSQRWWVQGRYEKLGLPHSEALTTHERFSGLLGFFPSEFSGVRLQYDHEEIEGQSSAEHTFSLQYNISIGAHPAHMY